MKKVFITFFLVALMLLLPINTAIKTDYASNVKIDSETDEESPQLFITKSQYATLDSFIENNFEGEVKQEAISIVDNVTSYDPEERHYKINMSFLIDAVDEHGYYKVISESELADVGSKSELNQLINERWNFSARPLGILINEIINLIKNRLGWLYELFYQGGSLFVEGVGLAKDFIDRIQDVNIAILFTAAVNLVVYVPIYYFSESVKDLFNLDLEGFLFKIQEFTGTFTSDLYSIAQTLEDMLSLLGNLFKPFQNYVSDISDFLGWIDTEDPWNNQITVKGTATNLIGQPIVGANVTCRGVETTTDNNGYYEFKVNASNNSNDSFPPNSIYGLHNCTITISKDGEVLKQTPTKLSYAVSGGQIYWPFLITNINEALLELIEFIIEKINILLELFGLPPINLYNLA